MSTELTFKLGRVCSQKVMDLSVQYAKLQILTGVKKCAQNCAHLIKPNGDHSRMSRFLAMLMGPSCIWLIQDKLLPQP